MDTQEILNLQEAYMNVYSSYELDEEEADRLRDRRAEAGAHWGGGNDPEPRRPSSGTSKPQTEAERKAAEQKHKEASDAAFASVVANLKKRYGDNAVISSTRTRKPGGSVSEATAMAKRGYMEQYDLYDILLSHLLDEGYADTIDSAEVIMDNMSEEWVDDILEANRGDQYATRGMNLDQAKREKQYRRSIRNQPQHPGTHTPRSDNRAPEHQASRGVRGPNSRNNQILNRENPKPGTYSQMQSDNPVERKRSIEHGKKDVASRRSGREYVQRAMDAAGNKWPRSRVG